MLVEMDPGLVAHNYLKTWLPLDLVSGIPFMLIDRLVSGGGCDDAELQGVGVSFNCDCMVVVVRATITK